MPPGKARLVLLAAEIVGGVDQLAARLHARGEDIESGWQVGFRSRTTYAPVMQRQPESIERQASLGSARRAVTVFAAHGMGSVYHASWNLPEILDLLGYGREQPGKEVRQQPRDARVSLAYRPALDRLAACRRGSRPP